MSPSVASTVQASPSVVSTVQVSPSVSSTVQVSPSVASPVQVSPSVFAVLLRPEKSIIKGRPPGYFRFSCICD